MRLTDRHHRAIALRVQTNAPWKHIQPLLGVKSYSSIVNWLTDDDFNAALKEATDEWIANLGEQQNLVHLRTREVQLSALDVAEDLLAEDDPNATKAKLATDLLKSPNGLPQKVETEVSTPQGQAPVMFQVLDTTVPTEPKDDEA